jgi:CubicO group peptidase (beta-lactamase class C family)
VQGSVLVLRGDEVRYEASNGPADTATGIANAPDTRFQIASISKQMTAAAVLLLAEQGALTLTDPVSRWIGGCPDSWTPITLHQLLTHSSGLGHWPEHPMIDLTAPMDPDDLIATFQQVPLCSAPGAGWHYSSPGYVLLAHVVQRAADESYREFLADRIFAPLGMTASFAGSPPSAGGSGDGSDGFAGAGTAGGPGGGIARGHAGDRHIPSYELDVVGMGAGDVWSTVGDLRAWVEGLRAGLLTGGSLRQQWTPYVSTGFGSLEESYGYGWFLGPAGGRHWRSHSGHNDGFKAFLCWAPETDDLVIILSNQDGTTPEMRKAYLDLAP